MDPPWEQLAESWQDAAKVSVSVVGDVERDCDRFIEDVFSSLGRIGRGANQQSEPARKETDHTTSPEGAPQWLTAAWEAVQLWYRSDFIAAADRFRTAIDLIPSNVGHQLHGRAATIHLLTWGAASLIRVDKLSQARRLLSNAQKLLETSPWPNCRGWMLSEFGRLAYWEDEIDIAHSHYASAEVCFQSVGNRVGLGNIHLARARLYTHEGRYNEALIQLAEQETYLDRDDPLDRATRLFHIGRVFRYQEKYEQAREALEAALELVTIEHPNLRWEANIRDVLGDVCLLAGDVRQARRHFDTPVFCRSADPVIVVRHRYQQAKLQLADLDDVANQHGVPELEALVQHCDSLIRAGDSQMIREKALILKGEALRRLGAWPAAIQSYRSAAAGFHRHKASWYRTGAVQRLARTQFEADQTAEAAKTLLHGLRIAVDDQQKQRAIAALKDSFGALNPELICAEFARLLTTLDTAARERERLTRRHAGFKELVRDATLSLEGLGGLPHLKGDVADLENSRDPDAILPEMKQHLDDLSRRVSRLRAYAIAEIPQVHEQWTALPELAGLLDGNVSARQSAQMSRHRHLGVLIDADAIKKAVQTIQNWLAAASTNLKCDVKYDPHQRTVSLAFRFTADSHEHRLSGLFQPQPPQRLLADLHLSWSEWSSLYVAAETIVSQGGRIVSTSVDGRRRAQDLMIQFPVVEIPTDVMQRDAVRPAPFHPRTEETQR